MVRQKSIEESVVVAMDGSDIELFPFLPYILQDLWEIGANPEVIVKLIRKYCNSISEIKVLDLGCGKGAVSVQVAQKLGCRFYGIDAIAEFVEFARHKAKEFKVSHLCTFETGDIREKVKDLSGYDAVILGAIGPVFGDYFSTLSTLAGCLNEEGIFIIDDGYINDDSDFNHPLMFKKSDILQQIEKAGMKLIENDVMNSDDIRESDVYIYENLTHRCYELIEKYPDKKYLFLNYLKEQEIANDILENKVIGTTMVIKKKQEGKIFT